MWACEKWHIYIWGKHFKLRTDYKALTTLLSTCGENRKSMRIVRWGVRLMNYTYTVEYKPGHTNVLSDCLSRLPSENTNHECFDSSVENEISAISSSSYVITLDELKDAYSGDAAIQNVIKYTQSQWPRKNALPDNVLPFYPLRNEFSISEGFLLRSDRLVVPETLTSKLITLAHESHPGIVRTKQRIRMLYWWPGMDKQVYIAIKSCLTCQSLDKTTITRPAPLQPVQLPDKPWQKLAIDIVGKFEIATNDCKYAIVLMDYYSKWPEVCFVNNVTSDTVIEFLQTLFAREGFCKELVTDNGSQFVSATFSIF